MKRLIFILAIFLLAITAQAQTTFKKGIIVNGDTIPNSELAKIPEIAGKLDTATANSTFVKVADGWQLRDSIYFKDEVDALNIYKQLRGMGGSIISAPLFSNFITTSQQNLSDNTVHLVALQPVPNDTTATGIKVPLAVQGSFTADNFNGVALFEVALDGTYSRVAISADLPDQWKVAAASSTNPPAVFPFTSTVAISKSKMYVAALMYNNSSQTTAPAPICLGSMTSAIWRSINATSTNFRPWSYILGQNTIPSSISVSATSASSNAYCVILY